MRGHGCPGCGRSCRLCDALDRHGDDPAVARLLDRLRDELTVASLRATGLGPRCPDETGVRGADRLRAVRALGHGPLLLRELVREVYPVPTPDADETALRAHRVRRMVARLVETGKVERIGHGVYALTGWGPREKRAARIGDCRRVLTGSARGLTVTELAGRLDAPIGTVRAWLARLREQGVRVLATPEPGPRPGAPARLRYRIDAEAVA